MNRGELFARADEQSLHPLLDLSDHLTLENNRIQATDHLEVPLDQYGIPQRTPFLRMALGSIASDYFWTGYFDVHHIAWPRTSYGHAPGRRQSIAAKYRECESLKLRVPRQLHNYFHKVTLPPPPPNSDVMYQYIQEQEQVNKLFSASSMRFQSHHRVDEETKEQWRKKIYIAKLNGMTDGELGLLPDLEYLSTLEPYEARAVLRSIARVQGLASVKNERHTFFKEAA